MRGSRIDTLRRRTPSASASRAVTRDRRGRASRLYQRSIAALARLGGPPTVADLAKPATARPQPRSSTATGSPASQTTPGRSRPSTGGALRLLARPGDLLCDPIAVITDHPVHLSHAHPLRDDDLRGRPRRDADPRPPRPGRAADPQLDLTPRLVVASSVRCIERRRIATGRMTRPAARGPSTVSAGRRGRLLRSVLRFGLPLRPFAFGVAAEISAIAASSSRPNASRSAIAS